MFVVSLANHHLQRIVWCWVVGTVHSIHSFHISRFHGENGVEVAIGWPPHRCQLRFHLHKLQGFGVVVLTSAVFSFVLGMESACSGEVAEPSEEDNQLLEPPLKRAKLVKHSNAGYYCSVPLCSNRSGELSSDGSLLHFHRFPSCPNRMKEWTHAIRREIGKNFAVTSNTRVCSSHFRPEDYRSAGRFRAESRKVQRLNADAVPSVFAWSKAPSISRSSVERAGRAKQRASKSSAPPAPSTVVQPTTSSVSEASTAGDGDGALSEVRPGFIFTPAPSVDHVYHLRRASAVASSDSRRGEELEVENARLRKEVRALKSAAVTLEALKDDDSKFKHFTGLPNYGVFCALLRYLKPKAKRLVWWRGGQTIAEMCTPDHAQKRRQGRVQRLTISTQFFLVLRRLRTGASIMELAHCASMSMSQMSKLFTTWINFLDYELMAIHKFPSTRPRLFIKAFAQFPHTRVIIDCTEVFTKRPSGLGIRKQLFSTYKHHNTVKFLVGISPSGAILYVSGMWGGRASDQMITRQCGLLDSLGVGQDVMADRGFDLEVDLQARGIRLFMPSFVGSHRTQLTSSEVTSSRRVAEARVHVERAIERIKEFRALCGEVDLSLLHVLQQAFRVCAFLTNFQRPIVRDIMYLS